MDIEDNIIKSNDKVLLASRIYHEKHKDNEDYKLKKKNKSNEFYYKNRDFILSKRKEEYKNNKLSLKELAKQNKELLISIERLTDFINVHNI